MLIGMIWHFVAPLLMIGAISAQSSSIARIRILFPKDHSERAFVTYGLHDAERNNWRFAGGRVSAYAGGSAFEVRREVDRFKALAWEPGCNMKHFDTAVQSDVELHFTCDPANVVPLHGRIKGIEVGNSAQISVDYVSLGTLSWFYDHKGFAGSFAGPRIARVATAAVAPDGTFTLELPDFNADPVVSDDGPGELEFHISGLKDHYVLCLQSLQGLETKTISIEIAPSYPTEVTFLAVPLRDF